MKKGCLGCLGCGCLVVILSIVIPCVWFYHWADTSGRAFLADAMQKLTDEGSKYAFEPETVAEIASLTKVIHDDLASGKLGVVDTYKYVLNNIETGEKLQSQVIFAVIYRNLTGKVKDSLLVDEEGAEAVRTIMYALSQGKIDGKNAASQVAPILEDKSGGVEYRNDFSGESFKSKQVKKNISKEDMKKIVEALKTYVKDQKLEAPAKDVTPDALAKEEVIKFLTGLKKLSSK